MKNLYIERVANGWIVRPYDQHCNIGRESVASIHVFTTVEQIQAALPSLLADHEPLITTHEAFEQAIGRIQR